jgi:hypothetical protein
VKKLDEKLSLLRMAEGFGIAPDPKLLEEIAYLKAKQAKKQKQQQELSERVHAAGQALFESVIKAPEVTEPEPVALTEEVLIPPPAIPQSTVDIVSKYIKKESTLVNPEPVLAKPTPVLEQKVKQLEAWISRIAATGPGGGAGDVINLDYPVKTITTSSYTILRKDHYIGVNVGTSTTIVLPTTGTKQGRNLIIKDESGHCSINPITLTGTIDNDTSGAILAIDNGGLHLIYNTGWRII